MVNKPTYTSSSGSTLLNDPLLNKECAFDEQERDEFGLHGLLPQRYETIAQQVERAYQQFASFDKPIDKHIFLRTQQDTNETLFYRLIKQHIDEMMPFIYTPLVGEACEKFSHIYRQRRGVFISYSDRHRIDSILANVLQDEVKVIVVTDGSRILGLGDQGIGGMGIPIGKLSLYTVCGGIDPAHTLPITLDLGTDNKQLREDPLYLGYPHPRIGKGEYDDFWAVFIQALKKRWPEVFLQFEDFEQTKAIPLLNRYRREICCFNDDIQGTALVTVGTLLAACRVKNSPLSEQTVVIAGAGSAGCGIAEQIIVQMCSEGLEETEARQRIFMIDKQGLVLSSQPLLDFQRPLAQPVTRVSTWQCENGETPSLFDTVREARPSILIGVSGQQGLFTETLIKTMVQACSVPIILPLSNPSKQIEATPEQLITWTEGEALIATGSPFESVSYQGRDFAIAQCNNSYVFPGIGLAVVAAKIRLISDEMLTEVSRVLAEFSPASNAIDDPLLPPLADIESLSKEIAFAVSRVAFQQELATPLSDHELKQTIEDHFWSPEYRQYRKLPFPKSELADD